MLNISEDINLNEKEVFTLLNKLNVSTSITNDQKNKNKNNDMIGIDKLLKKSFLTLLKKNRGISIKENKSDTYKLE